MLAFAEHQKLEVERWRHTRHLAFTMIRMWADPKTAPSTPESYLPLPGDSQGTEVDIARMTEAEQRQIFEDLRAQGWKV
jgi:hypothetical protein